MQFTPRTFVEFADDENRQIEARIVESKNLSLEDVPEGAYMYRFVEKDEFEVKGEKYYTSPTSETQWFVIGKPCDIKMLGNRLYELFCETLEDGEQVRGIDKDKLDEVNEIFEVANKLGEAGPSYKCMYDRKGKLRIVDVDTKISELH